MSNYKCYLEHIHIYAPEDADGFVHHKYELWHARFFK